MVMPHGSDEISIAEAALLFDISEASLRRKLGRGEISGAHRVKGKRGPEWRLPITSLTGLGIDVRTSTAPIAADQRDRSIRILLENLLAERARWEEWDRRLGEALAENARLRNEVAQLTEQASDRVVHLDPAVSAGSE